MPPILPDNHTLQTFFTTKLSHHQQPVCLPSNLSLYHIFQLFIFSIQGYKATAIVRHWFSFPSQ